MVDKRQAWVTEEQYIAWLYSLPEDLRAKVHLCRSGGSSALRSELAALRAELAALLPQRPDHGDDGGGNGDEETT